jgi:sodium transport system permease protein
MLTTSPRDTLLLRLPGWKPVAAALALAVLVQPLLHAASAIVMRLYPMDEDLGNALKPLLGDIPLWKLILLAAVVPAICEELAFRGFILSGLRHLGHKWRAIIFSAVFFGLSHFILQQKILTTLMGVVIGFIAVQAGSILPGMVFHAVHNGLNLVLDRASTELFDRLPVLQVLIVKADDHGIVYQWPAVAISAILAWFILAWFRRLPYQRSAEEQRQEAIIRAAHADG